LVSGRSGAVETKVTKAGEVTELTPEFPDHSHPHLQTDLQVFKPSRYNFIFELEDWEGSLLLYNSLTQAISRFPGHPLKGLLREVLEGSESPSRLPANFLGGLAEQGFLIPPEHDELSLLREKMRHRRLSISSYELIIAPTRDCNFRCSYCFEQHRPGKMDRQTVDSLKTFVANEVLPRASRLQVFWFGGEPLLAKDLVLEMQTFFHQSCRGRGVDYQSVFVTNGYLLQADIAAQLAATGTYLVWVTLDGTPEVHDQRRRLSGGQPTFARIYDNLRAAIDIFPEIYLRVGLDRDNQEALFPLVDLLDRDGLLSRVTLGPGVIYTHDQEFSYAPHCVTRWEYSRLLIELGEILVAKGVPLHPVFELKGFSLCGPLTSSMARIAVDPAGLVYKCIKDLGVAAQSVGRLHAGKVVYNERLQPWEDFDPTEAWECQECRYLPLCSNRCYYDCQAAGPGDQPWKCASIQDHLESFVKLAYRQQAASQAKRAISEEDFS
jgi:uncharacterized protein